MKTFIATKTKLNGVVKMENSSKKLGVALLKKTKRKINEKLALITKLQESIQIEEQKLISFFAEKRRLLNYLKCRKNDSRSII